MLMKIQYAEDQSGWYQISHFYEECGGMYIEATRLDGKVILVTSIEEKDGNEYIQVCIDHKEGNEDNNKFRSFELIEIVGEGLEILEVDGTEPLILVK